MPSSAAPAQALCSSSPFQPSAPLALSAMRTQAPRFLGALRCSGDLVPECLQSLPGNRRCPLVCYAYPDAFGDLVTITVCTVLSQERTNYIVCGVPERVHKASAGGMGGGTLTASAFLRSMVSMSSENFFTSSKPSTSLIFRLGSASLYFWEERGWKEIYLCSGPGCLYLNASGSFLS